MLSGTTDSSWTDEEVALADVSAGIRRAIEELPVLAASTPRATLPSVWNVPYSRNPFFSGRETELARIHDSLNAGEAAPGASPQAISGLGALAKRSLSWNMRTAITRTIRRFSGRRLKVKN